MFLLSFVLVLSLLSFGHSHDQISKIGTNPISVKTSISHNYISNNSPSEVAVLFDISTDNVVSTSDNTAPKKKSRDPYELAIVLDRSGSMSGNKIEQAKEAMISIVDNMIEGDVIHIIQYDTNVQTVIKNGGKASQSEIIHAIENIQPGGSTNLFSGLERAYHILKESIENRNIPDTDNQISHSRIFLFSDGLLNVGITDRNTILNKISDWKNNLDITISTFGIGYGFDRDIMTSIAEVAKGDFFFIDSVDSISKVIDIARKDAANILGTDAVLTIKTANNSNINIKLNDLFERGIFDTRNHPNFNQIKINDLRAGDSKYVLVELMIEPKDLGTNEKGEINILDWKLTYNGKVKNIKQQQSVFGTVGIQITNDDSQIPKNNNNDVVVLWDVNKMISLDKQIIDDISNGNLEQAKQKRKRRDESVKFMNEDDSMYNAYISKSGDTKMGQTILNCHRRLENNRIQEQMERLEEMGHQERENLMYEYQSAYILNQDMDYAHLEL